jgi:hypothetical protein
MLLRVPTVHGVHLTSRDAAACILLVSSCEFCMDIGEREMLELLFGLDKSPGPTVVHRTDDDDPGGFSHVNWTMVFHLWLR